MLTTERIRPGLHRIVGITCECGGELRIEQCGYGEFRWEASCAGCLTCDCNGWPTLAECVENAPEYFVAKMAPA